jgi:prepilin peptidase CpaA
MDLQISQLVALAVGCAACAWDLRTRRIPNALTLGSALAALAFHAVQGGPPALAASLGGWAVGLLLFLPFFLVGGMGAGDVKLLAALGAWLGPVAVAWSALYAGIAGGLLALGVTLHRGYLRQALANLGGALAYWRSAGPRPVPGLTLASAGGPRLAYALPIVMGMVAALWLR